MTLEFVVYGTPKTAGSKRAFLVGKKGEPKRAAIADANPESRPWKNQVAQVAGTAMQGRPLYDGPLQVVLRFFMLRPKGHYGKTGLNAQGRRNPLPAKKPDVLKLARAVEDAMTGVVYRDDALIVDERLVKEYGEPERVEIVVREIHGAPVLPASRYGAVDF